MAYLKPQVEIGGENPWDGRGSVMGVKLGDPARILTVGRRHGLLPHTSLKVYSYETCIILMIVTPLSLQFSLMELPLANLIER